MSSRSSQSSWLGPWLDARAGSPAAPRSVWVPYIWAFVGAFLGLATLQGIFHAPYFIRRAVPQLIPSYGATAVLCYGLPEAPLAQPRAVLGGHFLSALVGIIVTCIFKLDGRVTEALVPDANTWAAASLSTAVAIVVMRATKTTHPPAGATALLPIVHAGCNKMGWYYLPIVLLSSIAMVVVAIITNNMQRRYPVYWWAPAAPEPATKAPESTSNPIENVLAPGELLPVARRPGSDRLESVEKFGKF